MGGLEVKPFGKDGVRLCWQAPRDAEARGEESLQVEMKHGRTWRRHSTVPLNGESSGVTVVKSVGEGKPAPRTLAWRVRLGSQATAGVLVGEKTGGASEEDSAPAVTGHGGNAATSEDDIKSCGFHSCASSGENTDGPSDDELRQHLDTVAQPPCCS